jgi:hypothetical protein
MTCLRRLSRTDICLVALLALLNCSHYTWAFSIVPSQTLTHRTAFTQLAAIANSPQDFNEFSRKISTEKILGGKQGRRSNVRDFHVELQASTDECDALAKRFQLKAISALQASLSMRPSITGDQDIQVVGSMLASVTQICVRTNDSFEVSVEVPIDAMVRPVQPEHALFQTLETVSPSKSQNNNNDAKKKKKQSQRTSSNSKGVDDIDLSQLQRLVNSDILHNDDTIMEDEAILTIGGMLDVGELVSQLFWLSLDPYPRKPGSEWTPTSMTG